MNENEHPLFDDCPTTPLGDTDPMPFGKHHGVYMQDVPADYLHWLWNAGKKDDKQCRVAAYIRENLQALKEEHPGGVW